MYLNWMNMRINSRVVQRVEQNFDVHNSTGLWDPGVIKSCRVHTPFPPKKTHLLSLFHPSLSGILLFSLASLLAILLCNPWSPLFYVVSISCPHRSLSCPVSPFACHFASLACPLALLSHLTDSLLISPHTPPSISPTTIRDVCQNTTATGLAFAWSSLSDRPQYHQNSFIKPRSLRWSI
jgi:hypothetical protein